MKFSSSLALALPILVSAAVDCDYDTPASAGDTCASFANDWGLTTAQLISLNPGLQCPGNLVANQNYCVDGTVSSPTTAPQTTTTKTTATKTTITTGAAAKTTLTTTTSSSPYQPQQSGLAANCNSYYKFTSGDSCGKIEAKYGISSSEFLSWNPSINSQCSNLFAGYYVCVGVPGATFTTAAATTTTPSNGITTPSPVQSGMTGNCNNFYDVKSGDSCGSITNQYGISLSQFYSWNPAVGSQCASLWVGYNVCVGVIGETSTPSTTTPSNGIATPSPTQSGIASNCNSFYDVKSGDSCSTIASNNGIPLSDFYSWNPAVGSSCQSLWVGYYVCVDVVGFTPSPTTAGNGVTTPTPYEPGMVGNCNRFYYVQSGDTCDSIASSQGVSTSQIEQWNPQVGSDCSDLYLNTNICTGTM